MPNYGTKGDLLDMYDINRRPQGYTKGYFEKREAGEFFLASHVWIINDKKQFLIQKRSPTKVCEPGKWSVTGGVADSGENTLDCCIRETKEEVNLDVRPEEVEFVMSAEKPDNWGGWVDVYLVHIGGREVNLVAQKEELSDIRWADADEIKSLIAENKFAANVLFAWPLILQKTA